MHAMPRAEYLKLAWADPAKGEVDFTAAARERAGRDRARPRGLRALRLEALHAQSRGCERWLHRIDRPTLLLWGAEDGIVTPAYGEGWRQRDRRAPSSTVIPRAGHFPHWEQPEAFVEQLAAFA